MATIFTDEIDSAIPRNNRSACTRCWAPLSRAFSSASRQF
jgi:hypothetical protein